MTTRIHLKIYLNLRSVTNKITFNREYLIQIQLLKKFNEATRFTIRPVVASLSNNAQTLFKLLTFHISFLFINDNSKFFW